MYPTSRRLTRIPHGPGVGGAGVQQHVHISAGGSKSHGGKVCKVGTVLIDGHGIGDGWCCGIADHEPVVSFDLFKG